MDSGASTLTINPQLLLQQQAEIDYEPDLDPALSAALNSVDWRTPNIDRLASSVLKAQDAIFDLPCELAQRLHPYLHVLWHAIGSRITLLLNWSEATYHLGLHENSDEPHTIAEFFEVDPDSDVDETESNLFAGLHQTLRDFSRSKYQSFLVVRPLAVSQRRHVHAIAHFKGFGHISIGLGAQRMILLSKNEAGISSTFKQTYKQARSQRIQRCRNNTRDPFVFGQPNDSGEIDDHYSLPHFNADEDNDPYAGYSSVESSASASSHWSHASKRVKRKREPAAFECTHPGCTDKFDRWFDLNHHSRVHLAYQQRPYPCEQCDKRFLFPKDLRRHESTRATGEFLQSQSAASANIPFMPRLSSPLATAESIELFEKEQKGEEINVSTVYLPFSILRAVC